MHRDEGLSAAELDRYSRQIVLPQIGREGQMRLKRSAALIVGAGGLGSPAAMYLAAAGVGRLGIVDADRVDASNMQRQILHRQNAIGTEKALSAQAVLRELNPETRIETHVEKFTADNASRLLAGYDVLLGCVDNFAARYAIDAACVAAGKANIFGSVSMFEGQAGVFRQPGSCYRCFFRDPPPTDWRPDPGESGVLGVVPGVIGCIQAAEAIKALLNLGQGLEGRLLLFDALRMRFREVAVKKDPSCPVCGGAGVSPLESGNKETKP